MKKITKGLIISTVLTVVFAVTSANAAQYVIPSGETVGVKIYTDGLLVVGISSDCPQNGIKTGDRIKKANNTKLVSTEQLVSIVNKHHDSLTLNIVRNGEEKEISARAVQNEDGTYKLGVWVRDSTAGIGTVTYYDAENNSFAALGHGITDIDTGNILTVKSGNILPCQILSVTKSENGNPGELNGTFGGEPTGDIIENADNGIYGKCQNIPAGDKIEVASPDEITEGDAAILAEIDGKGIKEYSISITKVSKNERNRKNLVLTVTDENLLNLTGGIVQGMSGAPIIQNGKLIGAVTHVFINDSAKGYGTFAKTMTERSDKL